MLRRRCSVAAFVTMIGGLVLSGCTSIDCPLNNTVRAVWSLDGATLTDSLTVSTAHNEGNDTVLINRQTGVMTFQLPVSYGHDEDVFFFERSGNSGFHTVDTVTIGKEDLPHFESVDCNPTFFHILTSATTTQHGIDSVVVSEKNVNFDTSHAHLKIYFKSRLQ